MSNKSMSSKSMPNKSMPDQEAPTVRPARPVARWSTVPEAGRNRLVMTWSVPGPARAAAPADAAIPAPATSVRSAA
jgi:hypothetical protein